MTAAPPALPPPDLAAPAKSRLRQLLGIWDAVGMAVLYLGLFAACAATIPNFLSPFNLSGLAQSIISVGIVACGMLFCLASGDFDLSVGSVAALSGVIAVLVTNKSGTLLLGIPAGLAAGAFVGLCNGLFISRARINALITTLATMQIARGLAHMLSGHQSVGSLNPAFNRLFGSAAIFHFSTTIWLLCACFAFFGFLFHASVLGRKTLAIGGNAEAARRCGINVPRTKTLIFTLQGTLAALAGIVEASQLQNADPKASAGLELAVISACVLGGVSLTGGIGSIVAVIVGTLIMGTVQNAMNAKNIDPDYQYLITGGILLAAALYDRLKRWLVG